MVGCCLLWVQVSCPEDDVEEDGGGEGKGQSYKLSPRQSVPVQCVPPSERRSC